MVDQQERITRFRERLRAEPASGVFVPLADVMAATGDVEGALAVLQEGLARNPRSIPGRVVLGRTLLALGRQDEARVVLMEVLVADAENLVARHLLAEDCRKRGDWDGAVVHLEQLTHINPGEVRWLRELAEARARRADAAGEPAAEAEPAGVGGDKDEDAGFATMTMVEIYLAQGYRQQAIEALRRILEAEPEREDARQKLESLLQEPEREPTAEPPAPAPPAPPSPRAARPGESREERALRRAEDKDRFAAWVEKIRKQGEPGP